MSSLNNKVVFFTGATSGLGRVAAIQAAAAGATVIATFRSHEKSKTLHDDFVKNYPNSTGKMELLQCDLNSLSSIKVACNEVKSKYNQIDVIVNNAGIWNFKFAESNDGIESTLQVNLLAPILIINSLLDLLKESENPKVINTASALHQGTINFDNIEFRKSFNGFKAYRQSKLGIILITRLYQLKFKDLGIHFYSQHPGLVDTELVRKGMWLSKQFFRFFGKTPKKGAETLIHLLDNPISSLSVGDYYKNCRVTKTDTKASYDLALAEKLDEVCKGYLKSYIV